MLFKAASIQNLWCRVNTAAAHAAHTDTEYIYQLQHVQTFVNTLLTKIASADSHKKTCPHTQVTCWFNLRFTQPGKISTHTTFSAWASRDLRLLVTFFSSSSSSAHLLDLRGGRHWVFVSREREDKERWHSGQRARSSEKERVAVWKHWQYSLR